MLPLKVLTLLVQVLAGGNAAGHVDVATSGMKEGGGLPEAGATEWHDDTGSSSRIHGGAIADPGEFKSTVLISVVEVYVDSRTMTPRSRNYTCTGTIISKRWVLTAAHCLPCPYLYQLKHSDNRYFPRGTKLEVRTQCDGCSKRKVISYFVHEEANITIYDCLTNNGTGAKVDVAVLKLDKEVDFNYLVGPSALMSGRKNTIQSCVAQGYGDQFSSPPSESVPANDDKLHYVHVTVGNDTFCRNLDYAMPPGDYYVCAQNYGNPANSACHRDSGAALLCRAQEDDGEYVAVGVLTAGLGTNGTCGTNVTGMMYISTGHVEKWIRNKTNDSTIVFKTLSPVSTSVGHAD